MCYLGSLHHSSAKCEFCPERLRLLSTQRRTKAQPISSVLQHTVSRPARLPHISARSSASASKSRSWMLGSQWTCRFSSLSTRILLKIPRWKISIPLRSLIHFSVRIWLFWILFGRLLTMNQRHDMTTMAFWSQCHRLDMIGERPLPWLYIFIFWILLTVENWLAWGRRFSWCVDSTKTIASIGAQFFWQASLERYQAKEVCQKKMFFFGCATPLDERKKLSPLFTGILNVL